MNVKYSLICLLSIGYLGLGGCGNNFPAEYPEYQPFFRLAPDKKETAIFDYSFDQQIDLMILSWTRTHPPLHLYSQVAKNGEPIVPVLIQRIVKSSDIQTLRPLVLCLHDLDKWNFKWTTHRNYLEMWEKAIEKKTDPAIQREAIAILETGDPHPFFKGLKKHGAKVDE